MTSPGVNVRSVTTIPKRTVALVGNPNTGKSTLFNALSGMRQRVGNYPGVTVESKKGQMSVNGQVIDLIDLPGTYSLAPRSPDEMVTVDVILGLQKGEARPDLVVSIVDSSNLDRNLYLTTQAMELGIPVVVALNMMDVAENQGIRIDPDQLSKALGLPVVAIQANRGKGLDNLKQSIAQIPLRGLSAEALDYPVVFQEEVKTLQETLGPGVPLFLIRRLLLDNGGPTEKRFVQEHGSDLAKHLDAARTRLKEAGCPISTLEARVRYGWIRKITQSCVQRPSQRVTTWTDSIDRILTHRIWGTLVFMLVMFLVFESIFTLARPLMKLITGGQEQLQELVGNWLPDGPFTSLLKDGILAGVGGVLVFLPQIMILFAFIAILEDCGYMARAAFLMDRLMSRCGLSGKSFIPMLSSIACAVPGIMATRVIENPRDRLTTILVAPLMSCSARLPVYVLIIGSILTRGYSWWVPGLTMFAMYLIGFVMAPLVALLLKRTLLRGETPIFIMEMPLYKRPSLRTVLTRVIESARAFLVRAGTMILATMVLVWALLYFPTGDGAGGSFPQQIGELDQTIEGLQKKLEETGQDQMENSELANIQGKRNSLEAEWKHRSFLGQAGEWIEPVVRPLGWDWRLGVATLASFPAREVVVGTLGILYQVNKNDVDSESLRGLQDTSDTPLGKEIRQATWPDSKRPIFTVPTALSLMVFFALCCQCASTLAVIRRETGSWKWPLFTFVYMTGLAYVCALIVYQIGNRLA